MTGPGITLERVQELKQVDYVGIRVTPFKTKGSPVQCYRCLEFGHTAQYCGRTGRCGWCGGPHWTHECLKQTRPKCHHCKGDHPTSFRLCPKRLKLIEEGRQEREEKAQAIRALPTRKVRTGRSYAAAAADLPDPTPTYMACPQPPQQPGLDANMLNLIMSLIQTVSKLTDKVDKLVALVMPTP